MQSRVLNQTIVQKKKSLNLAIVATSGRYINIQEKITRHTVLIECPFTVKNADLYTSLTATSVVLTTADNRLWKVSFDVLQNAAKSSGNFQHECCPEEIKDSEDIFGELLNKGKDAELVQQNQFPVSSSLSVWHIAVKATDLLYVSELPILDVVLWDNLIALILDDAGTAILGILVVGQKAGGEMGVTVLQKIALSLNSCHYTGEKKNKRLYFVHQADLTSEQQPMSSSSSSLQLPKPLFVSLFDREASILSSPAVLVCSDSGCVHSYVVKHIQPLNQCPRLSVICQMNSDIASLCQISVPYPKVQFDQNQDIISALTSALNPSTSKTRKNNITNCDLGDDKETDVGLLVLSVNGECCLFLAPREENSSTSVLTFSLPSSLDSCIVHNNFLVYSAGRDVVNCGIKLEKTSGNSKLTVLPDCKYLPNKMQLLKLVSFPLQDPKDNTALAVTSEFSVVEIHIEKDQEESLSDSDSFSLDDILQSINRCSNEIKEIKAHSASVDSFLLQLNILSYLKQQTYQSHVGSEEITQCPDESIISCNVTVTSTANGYSQDCCLKVSLINKSSVCLSNDWTFVVNVTDQSQGTENRSSEVHSWPLFHGLRAKSNLDFSVPINMFVRDTLCPQLQVQTSLVLHLKNFSFLPDFYNNLSQKAISVPFGTHDLNVLNFLYPVKDGEHFQTPSLGSESSLHRSICHVAEMRVQGCTSAVLNSSQNLTVKVGVSNAEAEKFIAPCDLLKFILSSVELGQLVSSSCRLQLPSSDLVEVTITQAVQDAAGITRDVKFWVTFMANSVELLNEVRNAVKKKLQKKGRTEMLASKSKDELLESLKTAESVKEFFYQCQGQLQTANENAAKLTCDMLNQFDSIDN